MSRRPPSDDLPAAVGDQDDEEVMNEDDAAHSLFPSAADAPPPAAAGCEGREVRVSARPSAAAAPSPAVPAVPSQRPLPCPDPPIPAQSVLLPKEEPHPLAIFTWGRGEDGQLGLGDTSDRDLPTAVDVLRDVPVRSVACGSGHTVVLSCSGDVYTWGRGDDGRLGHGDAGWKYVPRPAVALAGQGVAGVTCGSYHTAAVGGDGDLYTWGGGMYGKLGHGDEEGHATPRRVGGVLENVRVLAVACGSRHTSALTDCGHLYSWGDQENGVAGHEEEDGEAAVSAGAAGAGEGHQYVPRVLGRLAGRRVTQVSACGFHTACLTDTYEVYTWGEGKFGRLGHGTERNCPGPRLVEALLGRRTAAVVCGGFHTACLNEAGVVYTWGGGEHGQLGHGDKVNKLRPCPVASLQTKPLSRVTCGWSHSVALTNCGKVYTWGNGDHGKLGHGSSRKVSLPTLVERLAEYRVVDVASYNEHTAALVEPAGDLLFGPRGAGMVPVTQSYLEGFREMVNSDEFADITFHCDGGVVHAHRAILVARCPHFAAMFRSGMRESTEHTVRIPDTPRDVFLLFMEYLYTDTVLVAPNRAVELFVAADLYGVDRLRGICAAVVRRALGPENAADMLRCADEARCDSLKDVCMEYIVGNFDAVSKSQGIRSVSHPLLLEILAMRPV